MSWLDNYSTTNTFRSMYINGFIDISGGRLQTRSVTDGHLLIAGDTSLNGNLYVDGDISWNPNNLADNSIPSTAIIGGVVGPTGPAGANQSARKFITIVAPSNSTHTSSSSGFLEYIIFNIFNAASSDAKPMLYSNMSDVEYRIFYAASPIQHYTRKMAFRVTPGLWKCTVSATTGNSMEAGIWWLDHNRNAILDTTSTEPHGGYNWGTNQDVFIYVEGDDYSSTDALIVFEMDDDFVNTAYHAPVFHLEQVFEHTSLTGDDATNDDFGITSGINSWSQPSHNANDPSRTLQITLANSSTEVASFHSDADLSLNKRLFVGEFINTTNFYNVNSLLMPYYLVEWTNPSVGNIDTTYDDFRLLFKAGKLHTNIHSNQLSIEAGSGGLSNASSDPDNYVAFKVYPGVWELNFELNETGVGSNANANYVQFYLYHDNGSGTTIIHYSHGTSFTSSTTGYLKDFRYFTVPNGKSGWLRIFNSYSQSNRRMVVRNTGITINSATNIIPTVHLKCIQLNNWDGTDSTLTGVDSMNSTSIVSDWIMAC